VPDLKEQTLDYNGMQTRSRQEAGTRRGSVAEVKRGTDVRKRRVKLYGRIEMADGRWSRAGGYGQVWGCGPETLTLDGAVGQGQRDAGPIRKRRAV
jgi:hypothetical protein